MRRWRLTALGTLLLFVASLFAPFPSWADESPRMTLSLAQAVQLAWQNSPDVRAAQAEVDKAWEQRKDAADVVEKMSYIPATGPNVVPYADQAWVGLLMADANWQIAKKDLEDKKQYLAMQVAQAYYDVLAAQAEYDRQQQQLRLAEQDLTVARAGYWAGTATLFDLSPKEAQVEGSRKAVAAAKEALDKAYVVLNRLVGLPSDARPVLTDQPPRENLVVYSLDAEVARAIDSSAALFKAKKAVDIARWQVDYPYATGKYLKYNIATADLTVSEQNLQSAQDQLKERVLTTYRDIRALEEQIQRMEAQVKAAEDQVKKARLFYEVGMATKLDLEKAETALVDARAQLENLYCQHASALAGWNYLTGRPVVS
ncbi:outer membrane efflux protein [Ammonifex degensii KC4]|uniref:Outer membrane efflux protein n=1 Tax=Ammonifex degensii (strain DSM 10501 / KC4) TaxID=429009 RepID=C9RAB2_AMMDK|nr:TolC family protein [Ammonifex degensii]ACX51221.1 outer membrane efflux protein [Ammonifex degensii KC4]